jgi:hypothetical protein
MLGGALKLMDSAGIICAHPRTIAAPTTDEAASD